MQILHTCAYEQIHWWAIELRTFNILTIVLTIIIPPSRTGHHSACVCMRLSARRHFTDCVQFLMPQPMRRSVQHQLPTEADAPRPETLRHLRHETVARVFVLVYRTSNTQTRIRSAIRSRRWSVQFAANESVYKRNVLWKRIRDRDRENSRFSLA